jgi:hypothetical protein
MCRHWVRVFACVQTRLREDENVPVYPRERDSKGKLCEKERFRSVLAQIARTCSMGKCGRATPHRASPRHVTVCTHMCRVRQRRSSELWRLPMLPTAEIRLGTSLCIALSALGRTIMTTLRRLPHVLGLRTLCEPRRLHPPFGSLPCLDGCLRAHRPVRRWTEIDLGWLVSSETLLPPRADGSPQRRVPVIVMEELPRWQEDDFFTFYPALAAFLDIPPGLVAGGLRTASPSRPSALACASVLVFAGFLSSLQSTDFGKVYHKGVLLALIASGCRFVPGVPTNSQQAVRLVEFVEKLLVVFRENPKWCPAPCSVDTPVSAQSVCRVQVDAAPAGAPLFREEVR